MIVSHFAEEYRWKLIQSLIPKATASRVELDHDPDAETIQEHLGLVVTEDYSEHHACKEGGEKDSGRSYPPVVGIGLLPSFGNRLALPWCQTLDPTLPLRPSGCLSPSIRHGLPSAASHRTPHNEPTAARW